LAVANARENQQQIQKPKTIVQWLLAMNKTGMYDSGNNINRNFSTMTWLITITVEAIRNLPFLQVSHLFSIRDKKIINRKPQYTLLLKVTLFSKAKNSVHLK